MMIDTSANVEEHSLASIVIPAHNAERYIATTLRSARRQSYPHLEIIVVDDGSTDETAAIAESHAKQDKRVRVLRQTQSGVAASRNRGIAEAHGEYVAPLDADDLWHPENLSQQIAALEVAGPQAALCYASFLIIDEDDIVMSLVKHQPPPGDRSLLEAMVYRNLVGNGSAAVMRRRSVLAVGGYNTRLWDQDAEGSEDWQLLLSLAARYEFTHVPRHLIAYRRTTSSLSSRVDRTLHSYDLVMRELFRKNPRLPPRLRWTSRAHLLFYLATFHASRGEWGSVLKRHLQGIGSNFLFFLDSDIVLLALKTYVAPILKWSGVTRGTRGMEGYDVKKEFRLD